MQLAAAKLVLRLALIGCFIGAPLSSVGGLPSSSWQGGDVLVMSLAAPEDGRPAPNNTWLLPPSKI